MSIKSDVHIKNKKAYFDYKILDRYTAGIKLSGTEIKSIRQNKANINDAFCAFLGDVLYVRNMHIAEYAFGSFFNHDTKRDRILLLQKKELKKLKSKLQEKGLALVPLKIFIGDRGFAKLEIALAQGKKEYDKRQTIKERDAKVEMGRLRKL